MRQYELPRRPTAGRTARVQIRQLLETGGGLADQREIAELLVGEVVTNAYEHGSGRITLDAWVDLGILHVRVSDEGDALPQLRQTAAGDPRGRGLEIVDRLAQSWGVDRGVACGKTVWFALALVADENGSCKGRKLEQRS